MAVFSAFWVRLPHHRFQKAREIDRISFERVQKVRDKDRLSLERVQKDREIDRVSLAQGSLPLWCAHLSISVNRPCVLG